MLTIIISAIACFGTISIVLSKPHIRVKGYDLSIFFFPALIGALVLILSGQLSWAQVTSGLMAENDINPLKIGELILSASEALYCQDYEAYREEYLYYSEIKEEICKFWAD